MVGGYKVKEVDNTSLSGGVFVGSRSTIEVIVQNSDGKEVARSGLGGRGDCYDSLINDRSLPYEARETLRERK